MRRLTGNTDPVILFLNTENIMGAIYQITHTSGKRYIGSAVNLAARWSLHLYRLRKGKHHSMYLQHAWDKYGEESFCLGIILHCEPQDLLYYEQLAFDTMHPEYNMAKVAGSTLGMKHTPEACANIRAAAVARSATPEWTEKMKVVYRNISPKERAARRVRLTTPEMQAASLAARRTPEGRAASSAGAKTRAAKHNVFGEQLSVLEAAEKYGVPKALVKNRLKFMSLEDAVTRPVDTKKTSKGADKYAYEGAVYSMQGLADHLGVSKTTVFRRIKRGIYDPI